MSYLQVVVGNDNLVYSANGYDIAYSPGCLLELLIGKKYPFAHDYFNYLASQGWKLVSSNQNSFVTSIYTFEGEGTYLINWKNGNWYPSNDLTDY